MEQQRICGRGFQDTSGTEDWRVLAVHGVAAWFGAPSHAAGAALVTRIAELAEGGRVPDVDLRASGVQVWIPDDPPLAAADVELARAVSAAARELGLAPDPSVPQSVELGFDVTDKEAVLPVWRALLGYEDTDDLLDPLRREPRVWFQPIGTPRPLRNRFHLDIAAPHPVALERLAAARAAGAFADPEDGAYFGLVRDQDGNEADLIPLSPSDTLSDEPGTEDWKALFSALVCYPTADLRQAAELAAAVAEIADETEVALMVDLRGGLVVISSGKDLWEENPRFVPAARRIQALARERGLTADLTAPRFVQIAIDAVDVPAVREFWRAVLGYENDSRTFTTDIYDPRQLNPPWMFQQMEAGDEARRAQRNRIHVDLFVPDDQVAARVEVALAAGGRIAYDGNAPECFTVADPEGNEVDIARTLPARDA